MDAKEEPCPVYKAILNLLDTWKDDCLPIILQKSDPGLIQCEETMEHFEEWMKEAKLIAVAGHRRASEDRPEICSSESPAEHSEHGECSMKMASQY
jgi:hypothetical protein